jgi:hypothetical protein
MPPAWRAVWLAWARNVTPEPRMRNLLVVAVVFVFPTLAAAQADTPPPDATSGATALDAAPVEAESQAEPAAATADESATKHEAKAPEVAHFDLRFDGHLRVEGTTIVPDRFLGMKMPSSYLRDSLPNVGRNDGFLLGDARLNLRATYRNNLYVRLGFDGAVVSYKDSEDTVGQLSTGLKDAYMRYTFSRAATIFVGRFKPPYDVEELTPTEDQFFVHRALESRGVERHEGPHGDLFGRADVTGFAPGRQIGVMLGSDAALDLGSAKLGYALAVTNGNANDSAFNDNDLPAVYGRASGHVAGDSAGDDEEGPATYRRPEGALVGIAGFVNELSYGQSPNRYSDRVLGAGLDVAWHFMAFYLQGQVLAARTDATSRKNLEPVYSVGGHIQAAVQVPGTGFFPGYRFALFDPRLVKNSQTGGMSPDVDRVMLHTVGCRYQAESLPLTGALEYTHSIEQGGRAQPNDRVEAAMQVNFQ